MTGSGMSPCAACKLLRRRCTRDCVFAPYFPPDEPQKFANVHKVFGAANVNKMLQVSQLAQKSQLPLLFSDHNLTLVSNSNMANKFFGSLPRSPGVANGGAGRRRELHGVRGQRAGARPGVRVRGRHLVAAAASGALADAAGGGQRGNRLHADHQQRLQLRLQPWVPERRRRLAPRLQSPRQPHVAVGGATPIAGGLQ